MKIQILCHACAQCDLLENNVRAAANAIGIALHLDRIERNRSGCPGSMERPELIIDGEVRSIGRILSTDELKKLFNYILRTHQ